MKKYVEESRKILAVFHKFTNLVEPLSLDEAYLDVTGSNHFKGSATLLASEIRKLIFDKTGLTASAGIAPNKFLAKVASDWKKPNGQFVITPDKVDNFIKKLPVQKILGVGKVTAEKMAKIGLKTCGDLQKLSINDLCSHFGSFGNHLYDICRGKDDRPVVTSKERKSLSIEETFSHDLRDYEECKEQLPMLYKKFLKRFEGKDIKEQDIKTLFVKVKFSDFKSTTVERGLIELTKENFGALLEEGVKRRNLPIRLLGLGARLKTKDKKGNSQQLSLKL
jgi:DNA polymerase-4